MENPLKLCLLYLAAGLIAVCGGSQFIPGNPEWNEPDGEVRTIPQASSTYSKSRAEF